MSQPALDEAEQGAAVSASANTPIQQAFLVLTAAIGLGLSTSHVYSFGLLIEPLEQEFRWTRSDITLGLTTWSVVSIILAPVMGYLADRIGVRRMALVGVPCFCAAVAMLSQVGPSIFTWWIGWMFIALGSVCIKSTIWLKATASRVPEARRGIAIALTLCGSGVASMLLPSVMAHLIEQNGWRTAYALLGGVGALVALPLLWFFFYDASDLRRREGLVKQQSVATPGLNIVEGLRSPAFWRLALTAFFVTSIATGMLVHFVPLLASKGVGRETAAAIAGAIGVGSIVGRLATGLLLDRFDARVVGALAFLLPLLGCTLALIAPDGSVVVLSAVAVIVGLSIGAEVDVLGYLASKHFGMRSYGALFGAIAGVISFASGIGPTLLSMSYDMTGGYTVGLLVATPFLVVSSLLIATLPQSEGRRRVLST